MVYAVARAQPAWLGMHFSGKPTFVQVNVTPELSEAERISPRDAEMVEYWLLDKVFLMA